MRTPTARASYQNLQPVVFWRESSMGLRFFLVGKSRIAKFIKRMREQWT